MQGSDVEVTHTVRPALMAEMRCCTDDSCEASVAALAGSMRISSVFSLIAQTSACIVSAGRMRLENCTILCELFEGVIRAKMSKPGEGVN